jgi:hypothetical protein
MSWAQALEILKQIVASMNNNAEGVQWLDRLERLECGDAHRLGYCIAIDIACGALTIDEYAEILDGVNISETCSRRAFATTPVAESRALKCSSRLAVSTDTSQRYVRVLTLGNFRAFYRKDRTDSPDDLAAIHAEHFSGPGPRDLAGIKELWSGEEGVVCILPNEDYDALRSGKTGDEIATLLNDALGLYKEETRLTEEEREAGLHDRNEFVGVLYPPGFVGARQPTTLDATWRSFGSYYVSTGADDGWGRTVSCSGNASPIRERVHKEFKKSMADFEGFAIGHVTERTENRAALLEIADRRLESILSSRPTPPI